MNSVCLVVLIGLPAAGKTSICQYFMQMKSLPFNVLHICYDNLINFNLENITQYKEQRENIFTFLKQTVVHFKNFTSFPKELQKIEIQFNCCQQNDVVILCDDNNYYRSMRYKLFQLAREQSIGYCQIYFNCMLKLALERNSLRIDSDKIPNDVILQMAHRLEIPDADEYKFETNTLTLQTSSLCKKNYNDIIYFIANNLNKPLQPCQKPIAKSTTLQSKVHELDLLLRKHITFLMSSKQSKNKVFAQKLNEKRREALALFQMDINHACQNDINSNKYLEILNNV